MAEDTLAVLEDLKSNFLWVGSSRDAFSQEVHNFFGGVSTLG